jgi:MraZ protein
LPFDGDGRVVLPEILVKKISLKESAIFVGKGTTFEIWQPEKFEEYMIKAKKDARGKLDLVRLKK